MTLEQRAEAIATKSQVKSNPQKQQSEAEENLEWAWTRGSRGIRWVRKVNRTTWYGDFRLVVRSVFFILRAMGSYWHLNECEISVSQVERTAPRGTERTFGNVWHRHGEASYGQWIQPDDICQVCRPSPVFWSCLLYPSSLPFLHLSSPSGSLRGLLNAPMGGLCSLPQPSNLSQTPQNPIFGFLASIVCN